MIQGNVLAKAIISGANNITNNKQMVDELNVFPVPDGDTGTNMSMTINAGKKELELLDNPTVEKAAEVAASALLRGARGNSGVILSLLFRGFAKGLKGKTEANGQDLAKALTLGVEAAYKAVMKPTEGTILTVARVAAEHATELALQTNDTTIVFDEIVARAKEALDQTPEMLPVLKKAGVVDAGGMGLLVIFKGMQAVICSGEEVKTVEKTTTNKAVAPVLNAVAEYEGEITFTYCTEFIVDKKEDCPDALKLRAYLETIGDSVVCVDDETIIKVHVHTNNPGNALQEGLKFGQLINMKIENMREQHQAKINESERTKASDEYLPVDPEKQFGFVAVCAGAGLQGLFADLGVDKIVSGGQTMNPSTDDILRAIEATPAETVFVLPNNKNIIMAAEQAVKLADRRVCVLQTRTIPQGISAMLAFDPEASYSENRLNMTKQFDRVQTGLVTFAARDSEFDGHSIKKGEILGLDNGKLSFTEKDLNKALLRLTKTLAKKSDGTFITIIYGSDVTDEQAEKVYNSISEKYGNEYEINLINGGQPVYYYILSVE
ncbi:DAK2 domain-containing protein [Paludicola sp. MB14-C6]|uniref:DAK2 domain-containing protein n=1 Tax=Paludihabitans sp. MB14-C6 TaxID=3070656 RepID=UPI0027DC7A85|nr:DAK2 domain-containing protein [Paludicola sp. MB14-C6]WMJ21996.1 DAK2 domain-containing protein [Paludicola sp. MB14-C6]